MKKFFEVIGFISLMVFSFYYTNKTASMVKNIDQIMVSINEEKDNYYVEPIDALINNNTIIPGLRGREVNVDKSYANMHKIGFYSASNYIYNLLNPKISISHNYTNYVIKGNPNKREVALIFKIYKDTMINNIIKILKVNNVNASFFLDGNWFENNNGLVVSLIKNGYTIGNMSYNLDYTNKNFVWMNTIISKVGNQKQNYCYAENNNEKNLNICALEYCYTIKPSIVVKSNPLIEIKNNLMSGSIISLEINDKVEKELPLIIRYIESKNLKIVNIDELIKE